jgi:hypothetical protein
MKRLISLLALVFIIGSTFCQSLEGDWKGKYVTMVNGLSIFPRDMENDMTDIKLRFLFNKDSTYTVYSFTKLPRAGQSDTTIVCKLVGNVSKDSVYLEEIEVVLPVNYPQGCFQKMFLRIREKKKFTEMNGVWASTGDKCQSSGTIYFKRKNE